MVLRKTYARLFKGDNYICDNPLFDGYKMGAVC